MELQGPAPSRRVNPGLAFFPQWFGNAYVGLLYEHLSRLGFSIVRDGRFTVRWLRRSRHTVDVLHFNWPQPYYVYRRRPRRLVRVLSWLTLARFAGRLVVARVLGYRVVWTVHEVYPHELIARRLDRWAGRVLARLSHALIAHDVATSQAIANELGRRLPKKIRVIPHGSYIGVYPPGRSRHEVRRELGIAPDAFVFLSFGSLRRYKDIDVLLEGFARMSLENTVLVVAGKARDAEAAHLVRAAEASDQRIKTYQELDYVPDDRVRELFEACDVSVVSRGDGGTSGALMLALSLGKAVIVADQPSNVDLVADHGCGWTFAAQDAASLAAAMEVAAADPGGVREKGVASLRLAETFRWADLALEFADVMVGGPRVRLETVTDAG
jgi:beta-1,4-mannosyltransferase